MDGYLACSVRFDVGHGSSGKKINSQCVTLSGPAFFGSFKPRGRVIFIGKI